MGVGKAARLYGMLLLGLVISFHPGWVWAGEEQSEQLYTRGLVPFRKGDVAFRRAREEGNPQLQEEGKAHYEQALVLFQQAAAEEPPYDLAVYYLGVTYGKLGRYAEAVPLLERTVQRRPHLLPAQQDLAVTYHYLGRHQDALALLARAERADPQSGLVQYYTGLSRYSLEEYSAAIPSLTRAAELDPLLYPEAYYYIGLAQLALGQPEKATRSLQTASEAAPRSQVAQRAEALTNKIAERTQRQKPDKRWELRLGISGGFDSNVILEPDDEPTAGQISDEDDFRLTFSVGGTLDLWRTSSTYLTGHDDFYQDVHLDIDDFDLQAHQFRLAGGWSPLPSLNLSVEGGTNYFRVGDHAYLHELYALPALGFFATPWAYTLFSYRLTNENYLVSFFDPARDGLRHEAAARQYFLLNGFERFLFVGYQYARENPSLRVGNDFQYTGHEAEVGVRTPAPWETIAELTYTFRKRDYDFANSRSTPAFSRKRDDDLHNIFFTLRKPLTSFLEVYVSYSGTLNNSNIGVFEYKRHIGSLGFRVVY